MKTNLLPSQEYLKECFDYNSETGKLYWKERPKEHFNKERTWKIWNIRFSGKIALNCLDETGYMTGKINGSRVKAHRVIYKLVYGIEPDTILHSNGNKADNKLKSISNGTHNLNCLDMKKYETNSSGVAGISWYKRRSKWRAYINDCGINKHLGYFDNLEDAKLVRKLAEINLGFHENHGREF